MAAQTKRDYSTNYAEFSIDSSSELSLLPTTTAAGSGALAAVPACAPGSVAYTTDGNLSIYTLDGEDNWNALA